MKIRNIQSGERTQFRGRAYFCAEMTSVSKMVHGVFCASRFQNSAGNFVEFHKNRCLSICNRFTKDACESNREHEKIAGIRC